MITSARKAAKVISKTLASDAQLQLHVGAMSCKSGTCLVVRNIPKSVPRLKGRMRGRSVSVDVIASSSETELAYGSGSKMLEAIQNTASSGDPYRGNGSQFRNLAKYIRFN